MQILNEKIISKFGQTTSSELIWKSENTIEVEQETAEKLLSTDPYILAVLESMCDEDLINILLDPYTMIGSDGVPASGANPHPRLYGCFPKILGKYVRDEKISNIKTNDVDMYANKAIYDKKNSIIELFESVKVIRGNEIITGDYGTLDTDTNSYKVKSNNSKKVKVIITENNE